MKTIFKRFSEALIPFVAGLGIGSMLIGPAAMALVFPGQFGPRQFPTQQVHYERHIINVTSSGFQADYSQNSCVFAAGTCSIRIAALPYNSFIVRAFQQVTTACNAGTTCTLAIGTSSAGVNIVAAQTVAASTAGTALTVVAANLGIAATGNGIAPSGADGGFDLFVTVTQTGTAATAGTIVLIIEYFAPNDGGCQYVPLGLTPTGSQAVC